ncbi:hypothetical protein AN1V17_17130 [Vallitalea sediminicola]
MKIIKAKIKIITPMCSYGVRQSKPEFRITELKSLMRSTFRELYRFENLKDMKEKEKELFGDIKNKSPIALKIEYDKLRVSDKKIIPHKPKFEKKCLSKGNQLKINLIGNDNIKLEMYIILLIQSSIIGSLGNRSRKGFGSFTVTDVEGFETDKYNKLLKENPIEIFCKMINYGHKYKGHFNICKKEQKILGHFNDFFTDGDFPYVKRVSIIKINKEYDEILYEISKLTHDRLDDKLIDKWFTNKGYKIDSKKINKNILGNCKYQKVSVKRFASPVHISFWENTTDKYMIVKELNYAYIINELKISEKSKTVNKNYVDEFVNQVKKEGR